MYYREAEGSMVMENTMDRHAIVAADKSKIRGKIDMSITVHDPPQAGEREKEGCQST